MEPEKDPIVKCTFDPEKEGPCLEKDCPHFPRIDWERCIWAELPPDDTYLEYPEPDYIPEPYPY